NGENSNQLQDAGKEHKPEFGVSYRAGYWSAARGGRLWMRGAMIRDSFGKELIKAERVMDKGSWRVVKFEGDDAWQMREIEGKPDQKSFTRVENCNHFEQEVNMVFDDPVWPEEIKAKRLQQLEME
ncbi:MAG: hypothetical protein HKO71_01270, partial [Pseudomonadales bacterium]|nr:hypothetical protein [Pseudomonadales bacterium]